MADSVASLVLAHNTDQNVALADADLTAVTNAGGHEDWIASLVADGYIDRAVEALPTTEQMAERIAAGRGLTNPELATVLSWTKIRLTDLIVASDLPEDPYVHDRLVMYFPAKLREQYADLMDSHRLRREIIATIAVNRFVHSQGLTAYHRLNVETSATAADVIRAQLAARAVFSLGAIEVALRQASMPASDKANVRRRLRHVIDRSTRWFLQRSDRVDIEAVIAANRSGVATLIDALPTVLTPVGQAALSEATNVWLDKGAPPDIAKVVAACVYFHLLPMIVAISEQTGLPLLGCAVGFFRLREDLGIDQLAIRIADLPRTDEWKIRARSALRDDLVSIQCTLTSAVLAGHATYDEAWDDYCASHPRLHEVVTMVHQVSTAEPDLARLSVALRALRGLSNG